MGLKCRKVQINTKLRDLPFKMFRQQPVIPTRSEVPERPPVEDRRNIGEFPYRRGETPIFNFDDGDEAFVQVWLV